MLHQQTAPARLKLAGNISTKNQGLGLIHLAPWMTHSDRSKSKELNKC
jgi:hypothetical protein